MSHALSTPEVDKAETREQAQRAVAAFRRLQPTLSAYARVISGNDKARVELASRSNGSTDGERIFYRPPIALGAETMHDRSLCDKRDADGLQACLACRAHEEVITTISHEIAHIAFNSFEQITDEDKRRTIEFAIKEIGGDWATRVGKRLTAAPSYEIRSYIGLANYVNEFMPFLVNALEDARVNEALFKAREGVRKMFNAQVAKVFREGFEFKATDGTIQIQHWDQAPLNSQVTIGVFCKASGYDYHDWFAPEVIEALNDEELTHLCARMKTIRSAGGVYNLAMKVLARLRELGFLGTKMDPDPEPEPDPEEGDDESSDASDGEEGSPDPDSVPEGAGDPDQSDQVESGSTEGEGGDEPSEADGEPSESGEEGEPDGSVDREAGEVDEGSPETDQSGGSDGSEEVPGDGSGIDTDTGDSDDREGEASDSGDSVPDDSEAADSPAEGDSSFVPESSDFSDGDESEEGGDGSESGDQGDSGNGDRHPDQDGDPSLPQDDEHGHADSSGASSGSESDSSPDLSDGDESRSSGGDVPDGGEEADESDSESVSGSDGGGIAGSGDISSLGASRGESGEPAEGDDSVASDQEVPAASDESDSDVEALDTGAHDDGYGGTSVTEDEGDSGPQLDYGTPEDLEPVLLKWMDHEDKPATAEMKAAEEAVEVAIIQGIYFTTPSSQIIGVKEHYYGKPYILDGMNHSVAWTVARSIDRQKRFGQNADLAVPESILQPALARSRRTFSDNQRGANDRGRRAGKVDVRALGKRAPLGDDRLFAKRRLPGRKDYFVVIGMDISGSTIGVNIALEKRAVMAQAELLNRVGIPFAIYAHTGNYSDGHSGPLDLDVYIIKEPKEKWDDERRTRLGRIGPSAANLDGHAMEYLRKRLDESTATEKILLYYSDGAMPAENHDEELEILRREIAICRRKGYTLLGVGIRTDSPSRHGLETARVDQDEDLVKVIQLLGKRLGEK